MGIIISVCVLYMSIPDIYEFVTGCPWELRKLRKESSVQNNI
ncbi:MAG: hypothetical protein QM398_07210 [Thermoproteota archaeon]|nr:hypothetical protein [Thermoproteota archaeon]